MGYVWNFKSNLQYRKKTLISMAVFILEDALFV